MADSIDIGSVRASAQLDASKFVAGIAEVSSGAKGLQLALDQLAAKTKIGMTAMADGMSAECAKMNTSMGLLQKGMKEQMEAPMAKFAKSASNYMLMAGGAIAAGLGYAVKSYGDYSKTLSDVAGNTNMTTAQIQQMSDVVQKLAVGSGAPMDQLAKGYMHIVNFGYEGADATNILTAAMKSAVSTGGDTEQTANMLASAMHEFGFNSNQAAEAMDILHDAAAHGNMTLEEMVESAGPAMSAAANLGVSLTDVAAAESALTRHGYNAADAATQLKGMLDHIAAPAINAKRELEELSKKSGIDLVSAFSVAGLRTKGFVGVLDMLKEAAKKSGTDVSEAVMKTIPAMRGGYGAMALLGTGSKDLRAELHRLNEIMQGKLHPTENQFTREQQTLAAQMAKVKEQVLALAQNMGQALAPEVLKLTKGLNDQLTAYNALPAATRSNIVEIAALVSGSMIAIGVIGKLALAIDALKASASAPIVFTIAFAVADAALVTYDIKKYYNLFSDIHKLNAQTQQNDNRSAEMNADLSEMKARNYYLQQLKLHPNDQKIRSALAKIDKHLTEAGYPVGNPTHLLDPSDFKNGIYQPSLHTAEMIKSPKALSDHVNNILKSATEAISGGGSHAGRSHMANLEREAQQRMKVTQLATEQTEESLMGHFQLEIHDAWKTFNQRIRDGVKKSLAIEELQKSLFGVAQEKAQALKDAAAKAQADLQSKFAPLEGSMQSFADGMSASLQSIVSWTQKRKEETDAAKRSLMTETEKEKSDALALFRERIAAGVERSLAQQEYDRTITDINKATAQTMADSFAASVKAQAQEIADSMKALQAQAKITAQWRMRNLEYLNPFEARRMRAKQDYEAEMRNGVNPGMAQAEYNARISNINREENAQKPKTIMQNIAVELATTLRNNLESVFQKLFGTHKSTLGGMLTSMLSSFFKNVVDQALSKIGGGGGGGGIWGGLISAGLGAFGFDDASNDSNARRYGFDFASNFLEGQKQYVNQFGRMAPRSGGSTVHVHVNMTGDNHYHSQMDANHVSQAIAWHASEMLRTRL